jgi:N-acetylmuramoyl-L-alanine amidase
VGCTVPNREHSPYLMNQPNTSRLAYKEPTSKRSSVKTVFLDPGHGGTNLGTVSAQGLQEKMPNLEIAQRVERILTSLGYIVIMSRRTDVFIPLLDRVKIAEKSKAQVFVSIHFNYAKNTKVQGAEVFYYHAEKSPSRAKRSSYLASCILKRLVSDLPTPSRGVKHGDLCVIRETTMPAVLVEPIFLSNSHDAHLLEKSAFKHKIARAIARGIQEYFSKEDHPRRESNARPVA